jgi:hypothetical protein
VTTPKPSARAKAKAARAKTPQTLKAWMEKKYRANPGLRQQVYAMVMEMLREQDAAGRLAPRRARKRGKAALRPARGSRRGRT